MADKPNRRIDGPDRRRESLGLAEALRALDLALGPPSVNYDPPVSTFPLTRAARAALAYARGRGRTRPPATISDATVKRSRKQLNQAETHGNREGAA